MRYPTLAAVALFLATLPTGCAIKIAPSTQTHMAALATQREFALAYARAAKTAGVATPEQQKTLSGDYLPAATAVNNFANSFASQVRQTSPWQTIDAARVDPAAAEAAEKTEAFVRSASAVVDVPRTQDFGATALAIAAAIETAQGIAERVQSWWQNESERQRKPFLDAAAGLKMPIWPEITPLEVTNGEAK
ncbi:MAG: hypothetical protein IT431_11770 [Phycisphaerales bacterium]|nr:hypothetical protein [Phycisphaerales bacterium]